MTEFHRFPHTPHVAWLGAGRPRDDKVMAAHDVSELLADAVVVEEKVDGANLGFSVADDGTLRGQNRGRYLDLEHPEGQWKPLKRWLLPRQHALAEALGPHLMLFGEWCYAVHSVRYTLLPDWFLAFDVYDRHRDEYWSATRRSELARSLGIETVPELGRGHYDLADLTALLGQSRVTSGPAEGLYIRREVNGVLAARAKLVRAEFAQAIEEHWSKRRMQINSLAPR